MSRIRFITAGCAAALVLGAALTAYPVGAQQSHGGHAGHSAHGAIKGDTGPSSQAYDAANRKMHERMDIAFTGNSDADFVRGMIPHHQGAIDMAKVVLQYGKDPQVRKLAEEVISAQEKEITWMKAWLAKNGIKP